MQNELKIKYPAITFAAFDDECTFIKGSSGSDSLDGLSKIKYNQSKFRMASVSKLMTSISIAQMIEKKVIGFDTPLMSLNNIELVGFLKKMRFQKD